MTPASFLHPLPYAYLNSHEEEFDHHFQIEAADPKTCPNCGIGPVVRFGKTDASFRDLPFQGKRTTLWVQRRRYRCNGCQTTFRPDLAGMEDKEEDYVRNYS